MNEEAWPDYILFCDDIVHKNLLHTVGVSIAYLADNMDPANNFPALFESRLELEIPNLIFIPSLDANDANSFNHLLINLVNGKIILRFLYKRFYFLILDAFFRYNIYVDLDPTFA